jgi:AcrR family transcriptional regulator
MLNMDSAPQPARSGAPADDRSTRARIRDAAIECYAGFGVGGTTARKVAKRAGVSPGLVIHHFGSMDGLRTACDEHVAAVIRHTKEQAIGAGLRLDVAAAWRDADMGHLGGYLATVLVDDSAAVARLVDELAADAAGYLAQGIETGQIRPIDELDRVAVILTLWSLGGLVLHDHMRRLLGVDPTDPGFGNDASVAAYVRPAMEILGEGIFTDTFAANVRNAVAGMTGPTGGTA